MIGSPLEISISFENFAQDRVDLCLIASFGIARVRSHKINNFGIRLFPYYIDFALRGGEINFILENCNAPIRDRLTAVDIPTFINEKITRSDEKSGELKERNQVNLELNKKFGGSLQFGDETTSGEKQGSGTEWNEQRPLLHASGPPQNPVWRFEASNRFLSGRAPGYGNPPLARLHIAARPATVSARFEILPRDVEVVGVAPAAFDSSMVAAMAVIRKNLCTTLAHMFEQDDCKLVVCELSEPLT